MVTIEQKLSLFSKLLHRSMTEKFTEEMEQLKKEYEEKIRKDKEAVKREAEEIVNRSRKKAEAERIDMLSKMRIELKRENISIKEKYFTTLLDRLKNEIEQFMSTEKYGEYLCSLANKMKGQEQFSDHAEVYLTGRDLQKYGGRIREELSGPQHLNVEIKQADDTIIGGFIVEDAANHIRMDYSIQALLEDNESYIMQTLFQAIEAGEADGT